MADYICKLKINGVRNRLTITSAQGETYDVQWFQGRKDSRCSVQKFLP